MKNIFKWTLCMLCISCSHTDNLLEDVVLRGGFIQFEVLPESSFNLLEVADLTIVANITDPNNNATNYALTLIYEGVEVDNFITINSFPNSFTITGPMILDALGITAADLTIESKFDFVATVTTPTGVFSGLPSSFNFDTNTQDAGNTAQLLFVREQRDAMNFGITFFLPPPDKIRGTSFEEPMVGVSLDADYTRPEEDADRNGVLPNNPGERHVMHVATGTGVDDEIGFKTEYFRNGGGGFTSEQIGVTQKTLDVGSYPDGIQGYQMEDIDGQLRLSFDRVEVPAGITDSGVQVQVFFRSTGYESGDTIDIYAQIEKDGGVTETIDLLILSGDDIEAIVDRWNVIDSGYLEGIEAYTLIIDVAIDSGNEEIYFDQMLVYK